ncbi:hypothetical protein FGG08_005505 [Glutinoglossum americanum]|uniref:DUF7923 domain-containing protein n=1 Tax=Glutinoglossum americanum TaxID=1670608 RepID=A0A9P8HY30_9PEZI|nr:hypothetical protein FGG08_005505 [Glutinoglossum americanum]
MGYAKTSSAEAALRLADDARDYVQGYIAGISYITARIYVNVSELPRALGRGGEVVNRGIVDAFVQGFNSDQLLFDFIDRGLKKSGRLSTLPGSPLDIRVR